MDARHQAGTPDGGEMSVVAGNSPEVHEAGERLEEFASGSIMCLGCGFAFSLAALDALPVCPTCGGQRFRRASIFEQPTVDADVVEVAEEEPAWLDEVRRDTPKGGYCLAFEGDDGEPETFPLEEGWTRIGRSGSADIRLDDATVSRRHAVVVLTEKGELRALDDRSLNGLFVNGERVEWAPLTHGDELEIGRYRLYVAGY
jgi:predicted  nucleic acid-binding Zn-ribbon protein